MDAIIPLMPDMAALLNTPTGAMALAQVFSALRAATSLDRLLAVGNDAGLLALAQNAGIAVAPPTWPHPALAHGILPTGGAEALGRLGAQDRRTLLVSCANPLLTGQLIDDFVRRAEAENRPLLSVAPPLDHPCQLSRHLKLREAGILLPLDPHAREVAGRGDANDTGRRLLTQPFRFLWTAQQTRGQGPLFVLGCTRGDSLFLSVPDQAAMPAAGPLLVREDETSARLSLPARELRELAARFGVRSLDAVTGVGLHLSPGLPCISFRDANGAHWLGFATLPQGEPGSGLQEAPTEISTPGATNISPEHTAAKLLCQLYARAPQNGQVQEPCTLLALHGSPPRARPPWDPSAQQGPVSYTLLEQLDQDGHFDLTLSYPEDGHGLWRTDPANACRINCATGRAIHGRQEFPEVLQPDGSLFALTPAEAGRFDALLRAGRMAGFVLGHGQSLLLRTPFDLLRYTAQRRMEEQ